MVGCATSGDTLASFRESDFHGRRGEGSASISGRAFVLDYLGDPIYGRSTEVTLAPATPYTLSRCDVIRSGGIPPDPDPRLEKYLRRTVTDGLGDFRFRKVTPGRYTLACTVSWDVPSPYNVHGVITKSRAIAVTANVEPEKITQIELTE